MFSDLGKEEPGRDVKEKVGKSASRRIGTPRSREAFIRSDHLPTFIFGNKFHFHGQEHILESTARTNDSNARRPHANIPSLPLLRAHLHTLLMLLRLEREGPCINVKRFRA